MDENKSPFDWMANFPPDYNWLAHDWKLRWQVRVFAADFGWVREEGASGFTRPMQPIAQFTSVSEDYQAIEDYARNQFPGRFLEFTPVSH